MNGWRDYAPASRVLPSSDQFSADIGGEHVVLSLTSERYYGLSGVASRVWEMVRKGTTTVGQIEETLLAEYDVDPARCRRDAQRFLRDLADRGLVTITEKPAATGIAPRRTPLDGP